MGIHIEKNMQHFGQADVTVNLGRGAVSVVSRWIYYLKIGIPSGFVFSRIVLVPLEHRGGSDWPGVVAFSH